MRSTAPLGSHHHDASGRFQRGRVQSDKAGGGGGGWETGRDADEKKWSQCFRLHGLGMTNTFQGLECNPSDFSRVLKEG